MKAGIVADDYKITKFRETLESNGFMDFEIIPFKKGIKAIRINLHINEVEKLKKLVIAVEDHFNLLKENGN